MTAFGRQVKQGGRASKRGDRNVYVLSPGSLECPTRPKAASESLNHPSAPNPYPDASSPCYHSHHSYQITRPGGAYIAWSSARVRMPWANNWRGQKKQNQVCLFQNGLRTSKTSKRPHPPIAILHHHPNQIKNPGGAYHAWVRSRVKMPQRDSGRGL